MSVATMPAPVARRNQNLYRQPATLALGPVSATFVTITLVSLLALLYLNQITKTSVFSYRLNDLTAQRNQLAATNQDLSVQAARLQSLQTVQAAADKSGLVNTGQVSYAQ